MIRVLGYEKSHKANWFKDIILDDELVINEVGRDSRP